MSIEEGDAKTTALPSFSEGAGCVIDDGRSDMLPEKGASPV